MNRSSGLKHLKYWLRTTPIPVKYVDMYVYSSIATFCSLFVGNMYHSAIMAYTSSDYVIEFITHLTFFSCASTLKSATYAVISPLFVPYALTKWLCFEPVYLRRRYSYAPYKCINKYGLLSHLIPLCYTADGFSHYDKRFPLGPYLKNS